MIAYALCWGLNIDIAGILYDDLTSKLTACGKKGREKNICYVRYLSLIIEHLLGEAYVNKDLHPLKSYQIIRATFKQSSKSEVPLTSHMRKVAKLSEEDNAEDTGDKSLSGTAVHPVSKPITDKKQRTKKNQSSSEPNISKDVVQTPTLQASESQSANAPEVPANTTNQSLEASKSAEEQVNQPQTADAKKVQTKEVKSTNDNDDEVIYPAIQSMGDVTLESLTDQTEKEIPYDTESEIKFVKRFKPLNDDDEPLITFLGPTQSDMDEDSDLASIPDDDIFSLSGSQSSKTEATDNQSQKKELSKSE
ncbi:hypothetical protein Tco_0538141 [Tanacetum coccineum]